MLLPLLAVLGSIISLCVGSSYAKHLFLHIGPEGTTVFRVGFAAILLLVIWRPWRLPLSRNEAKHIVLYGLTLGFMNLMFYKGISKIPIGVAIAIEFLGPLTLATLSSRRFVDFVWILFAVIGLLLLSPLTGSATKNLDLGGVVFILCAGAAWGFYIIIGKKAGNSHGGQVTSLGLLVASMVALPFGGQQAYAGLFEPKYVLAGCLVAVLSSAIPYSLELYALQKMPKQTFGILLSMEPAVGALASWIILGELLSLVQWIAIGAIIVASIGSAMTASKSEKTLFAEDDIVVP